MQARPASRSEQQFPCLRVDGLGNVPLFCGAGDYESCSVKIIRENKVIMDDPFGLHVVRDVTPARGAWVRFFFQRGEALSPGIYALHWMSSGGSGVTHFVVQDSPFNPDSSFTSLEDKAGFTEQMIYRGVAVLRAGETSVIIESPFELNPVYHRPAWALIDRNNKPITGVALEITEQFPKAWRVRCTPVSDQDRIIDWVVY